MGFAFFCCCPGDCEACLNGTYPRFITVDLSGYVQGSVAQPGGFGLCLDCNLFNNPFSTRFEYCIDQVSLLGYYEAWYSDGWNLSFFCEVPYTSRVIVRIRYYPATDIGEILVRAYAFIPSQPGTFGADYRYTQSGKIDCSGLSSFHVPVLTTQNGVCNPSTDDAVLTAVA